MHGRLTRALVFRGNHTESCTIYSHVYICVYICIAHIKIYVRRARSLALIVHCVRDCGRVVID